MHYLAFAVSEYIKTWRFQLVVTEGLAGDKWDICLVNFCSLCSLLSIP